MVIVLVGTLGPLVVPYPTGYNEAMPLQPPSAERWLGTDGLGLSLTHEIVWGARTSLFVSLTAVAVAAIIGLPLGLVSGYVKASAV